MFTKFHKISDFFLLHIMVGWLAFNANFSNISAISWHEQILFIRNLQNP